MQQNEKENLKSELISLIESGKTSEYLLFLNKYHEADIAEELVELPIENKRKFFKHIQSESGADIIEEMTLTQQVDLISQLKMETVVKYIKEMEPDDAVDLLEELQHTDEERANSILNSLPHKEATNIRKLLSYTEGSAGSLMTLDFVAIPENLSVKDAIATIRTLHPPDNESSYYVFIVTLENKLAGYTTLRSLLISDPDTKVREIRDEFPMIAFVDDDQENIAHQFKKYHLTAMPVIDKKEHLVGLITVDDVMDVVDEEATEDMFKLTGTSDIDEEKIFSGSILYSIFSRTPWLLITVFGGILASYIITLYSSYYDSSRFPLALSLSFVPLLMGLGGNVGNQAAAIFVRGIATEQIKESKFLPQFFKEVLTGFFMGLIISSFVFILNIFFNHLPLTFSLIVSTSLLGIIVIASFLGASLPILFKKINIDPAIASAPFISTSLDILGQLIYFVFTLFIFSHYL